MNAEKSQFGLPVAIRNLFLYGLASWMLTGCADMHRARESDTARVDEYRSDCNRNRINDRVETSATGFGFVENRGPFPAHEHPVQVLAVDLDRNGQRELVTLNGTNTDAEDGSLTVIRDSAIAANTLTSERLSMSDSPWVRGLVAADIDKDNDTDLIVLHETRSYSGVIHYTTPSLRVYNNDGSGRLTVSAPHSVGNRYDDAYAFAGVDLDGDRDIDFVMTRNDSGATGATQYRVSVLSNASDAGHPGELSDPEDIATFEGFPGAVGDGIPPGLSGIAAADIDDDSDVELVVPYCNWRVWPATGCSAPAGVAVLTRRSLAGGWQAVRIDLGDVPRSLATADVNRDGRPDLVVTLRDAGHAVVLINDGRGEISPTNPDYFAAPVAYDMGSEPWAFQLADLNKDGDPDMLAANRGAGGISVRLNLGDGNFAPRTHYPAGDLPVSVAVGRLGSGQFNDVAVANSRSDNVSVLWNESAAALAPDCNRNRKPDSCDITDGTSTDRDRNGIPDECPSLRPLPDDLPGPWGKVPASSR